jgi:phosphoserine phosphatase RsbU/P
MAARTANIPDLSEPAIGEFLRLQILAGPALEVAPLPPGRATIIGKEPSCHLRLDHAAVSRSHAMIEQVGGRWLLNDLGSRNGTFLNGERLAADQPLPLSHGDHLRIPPWVFRVALAPDDAGPHTIDDRRTVGDRLAILRAARPNAAAGPGVSALLKAAVSIQQSSDVLSLSRAVVEAALALTAFSQAALIRRASSAEHVDVLWSEVRGAGAAEFVHSRTLVEAALGGSSVCMRASPEANRSSSISDLRISSAACIPLMLDGAVWGCLYLDCRGDQFVHEDVAADRCQMLAELASLALRSVLRRDIESRFAHLQHEAEMAAQAQRLLLPPETGTLSGLQYALGFKPGRIVSGDLVGVVALSPSCVAAFVGDVTGKGMAAGLVMAAIQSYLTAALLRSSSLGGAVDELNRYLSERLPQGCFASLWVALFDSARHRLEYVDAGHSLAYIAGQGGLTPLPGGDGLWLGVAPERSYSSRELDLGPADRLIVMSDGVLEQPDKSGEQFGFKRLCDALGPSTSAAGDVRSILTAVMDYAASPTPRDDVTVASFTLGSH